jgi:hypothetical protein
MDDSEVSSSASSTTRGHERAAVGEGSARSSLEEMSLDFGMIVYDLETIHNAERGTYVAKSMHECQPHEQVIWKRQSQIIEFAAVDLLSGDHICVRSRPEFSWSDVRSPAARAFAEDHGHDKIVQDETLPLFRQVWTDSILPFLLKATGAHAQKKQLAIIAHNGDQFDHFVLQKELDRLGLMPDLQTLALRNFDPIRTLKQGFGTDFGSGGRLALSTIHSRHVPTAPLEKPLHQALSDCNMLLEVITHWVALRVLLATEIAVTFAEADQREDLCTKLISVLAAWPRGGSSSQDREPHGVRRPSSSNTPASRQPRASGQQSSGERETPGGGGAPWASRLAKGDQSRRRQEQHAWVEVRRREGGDAGPEAPVAHENADSHRKRRGPRQRRTKSAEKDKSQITASTKAAEVTPSQIVGANVQFQ